MNSITPISAQNAAYRQQSPQSGRKLLYSDSGSGGIIGSEAPAPTLPGQDYRLGHGPVTSNQDSGTNSTNNQNKPPVDTYQPSQPNADDPSQTPVNQVESWKDKVINWFNALPLWAKVALGGLAVGGAALGGRAAIRGARQLPAQISRWRMPTPLGSIESKNSRIDLLDSRKETKLLKTQHQSLQGSLEDKLVIQGEAEQRHDSYKQGTNPLKRWFIDPHRTEANRLNTEKQAAKAVTQQTRQSLKEVEQNLQAAANEQLQSHIELTKHATSAMVLRREDKLRIWEQRTTELETIIAKDQGKNKDTQGLQIRLRETEFKRDAARLRLAEAQQVATQAQSIKMPKGVYVSRTGLVTVRRGNKTREVTLGGIAVRDESFIYRDAFSVKDDTASYIKDQEGNYLTSNGNLLRGTGNIGFFKAKYTQADSPVTAMAQNNPHAQLRSVQESYTMDDGNQTPAVNVGGNWAPKKPNWVGGFFGILFGQTDWKTPMYYTNPSPQANAAA